MITSKLSVVIIDAPGTHHVLKLVLILTAFGKTAGFTIPFVPVHQGLWEQLPAGGVGAAGEEGLAAVSPPPCRQSHIK